MIVLFPTHAFVRDALTRPAGFDDGVWSSLGVNLMLSTWGVLFAPIVFPLAFGLAVYLTAHTGRRLWRARVTSTAVWMREGARIGTIVSASMLLYCLFDWGPNGSPFYPPALLLAGLSVGALCLPLWRLRVARLVCKREKRLGR